MNKDELIFDFKINTNSDKQLLWSCDKSINESFGTVVIHYTSGPCQIDIFTNGHKTPIKILNPGESYSQTCSTLKSVEISPKRSNSLEKVCCGKIGLIINHEHHKPNNFPILFILVILLALFPYFYCRRHNYPSCC